MRVLGIESSCDETAASVVEVVVGGGVRVRSSVVSAGLATALRSWENFASITRMPGDKARWAAVFVRARS